MTLATSAVQRIGAFDWARIAADLDATGVAAAGQLLDDDECRDLRGLYDLGLIFHDAE